MSLFNRTPPSQRSFNDGFFSTSNQLVPTRPPMSTAGVPVTTAAALQKVALMSACNLIANMPELLPLTVNTNSGGIVRQQPTPQVVLDPEGHGYGLGDFGYKFLLSAMLRGNTFTRVDAADRNAKPTVVTLLSPDEVSTRRNGQTGEWEFVGSDGKVMKRYGPNVDAVGSVIHTRAFPVPGQLLGLSIVGQHARTLGLSLASEQFAADFFADGAHPTGILTSDQEVTAEEAKQAKRRFVDTIRGGREPVALGKGLTYKPIQVAPGESQFLDVQKFTAAEICRMVGPGVAELFGYETGGAMTYQNIQSRSLHVLIYAIDPWLSRLERYISLYLLPQPQTGTFDREGILRMTAGDLWDVRLKQLKLAARTINEVRALDGDAPVPWGDQPYLPTFGPSAAAAEINTEAGVTAQPVPFGGGNQ